MSCRLVATRAEVLNRGDLANVLVRKQRHSILLLTPKSNVHGRAPFSPTRRRTSPPRVRMQLKQHAAQPLVRRVLVELGVPEKIDGDRREFHGVRYMVQAEGLGHALGQALGHGGDEVGGLQDVADRHKVRHRELDLPAR